MRECFAAFYFYGPCGINQNASASTEGVAPSRRKSARVTHGSRTTDYRPILLLSHKSPIVLQPRVSTCWHCRFQRFSWPVPQASMLSRASEWETVGEHLPETYGSTLKPEPLSPLLMTSALESIFV